MLHDEEVGRAGREGGGGGATGNYSRPDGDQNGHAGTPDHSTRRGVDAALRLNRLVVSGTEGVGREGGSVR